MGTNNRNEGRAVVTFKQLLAAAHKMGLKSIKTYPGEVSADFAFYKATVIMKDGCEFDGHAEATPANVAPAMRNCLPRMAETRAIVRALKLAVNIADVAAEEMAEYEPNVAPVSTPKRSTLDSSAAMTEQQEGVIRKLLERKGEPLPDMADWSQARAGEEIAKLQTR